MNLPDGKAVPVSADLLGLEATVTLPPAVYAKQPPAYLVNVRTGLRVPIPAPPK